MIRRATCPYQSCWTSSRTFNDHPGSGVGFPEHRRHGTVTVENAPETPTEGRRIVRVDTLQNQPCAVKVVLAVAVIPSPVTVTTTRNFEAFAATRGQRQFEDDRVDHVLDREGRAFVGHVQRPAVAGRRYAADRPRHGGIGDAGVPATAEAGRANAKLAERRRRERPFTDRVAARRRRWLQRPHHTHDIVRMVAADKLDTPRRTIHRFQTSTQVRAGSMSSTPTTSGVVATATLASGDTVGTYPTYTPADVRLVDERVHHHTLVRQVRPEDVHAGIPPAGHAVLDVDAATPFGGSFGGCRIKRLWPVVADAGTRRTRTAPPGGGKGRSTTRPARASGMNRCRLARERCGPIERAPVAFGHR